MCAEEEDKLKEGNEPRQNKSENESFWLNMLLILVAVNCCPWDAQMTLKTHTDQQSDLSPTYSDAYTWVRYPDGTNSPVT